MADVPEGTRVTLHASKYASALRGAMVESVEMLGDEAIVIRFDNGATLFADAPEVDVDSKQHAHKLTLDAKQLAKEAKRAGKQARRDARR